MPDLRMLKFTVHAETTEAGQDSPYFVFFYGNVVDKKFNVTSLRQPHWDNEANSGDTFKPNTIVVPNYDANTFVMCALMEEDDNADLVSGHGAFKNVKDWMKASWDTWASALGIDRDKPAGELMKAFRSALTKHKTDDDFIDCHTVHIPPSGKHDIAFKGSGGKYVVTFDVAG